MDLQQNWMRSLMHKDVCYRPLLTGNTADNVKRISYPESIHRVYTSAKDKTTVPILNIPPLIISQNFT